MQGIGAVHERDSVEVRLEQRGDRDVPGDVRERAVPADELVARANRSGVRVFRRLAVGDTDFRKNGIAVHKCDRVQDLRRVVERRVNRVASHRLERGLPALERVVVFRGRGFRRNLPFIGRELAVGDFPALQGIGAVHERNSVEVRLVTRLDPHVGGDLHRVASLAKVVPVRTVPANERVTGLLRGFGECKPFVILDLDRVHAVVPAVNDHIAVHKLLEQRGDRDVLGDVRESAVPADKLIAFARRRPRGVRRLAVGDPDRSEHGIPVHERDRVQDLRRVVERRVNRVASHRLNRGRPPGERVVVCSGALAGRGFRDARRRAVEVGGRLQLRAVEVEEADRVGAERLRIDRVVVKVLGGGGRFHVPALERIAVFRRRG